MCGIAGILSFNNVIDKESIKKMTDAILHRGPDGEGQWLNASAQIGLGHRRLSIIDLSENGKQPMHYADERYTITFNGEIYNYIELRESLVKKGYTFTSASDTEVILALYHLKEERCLQDLDGMFAFVIWDEQEQMLFCARDRFGEKPFYYCYEPGKAFYFASEMKALWAVGISSSINENTLQQYISYSTVLNRQDVTETFYSKIRQLDAACYLKIKKSAPDLTQHRYWSLEGIQPLKISFNEASQRFYDLLKQSIKLRLRSDVPVGSSLSGGLDSSSIVMLVDELKKDGVAQKSFSARFKNFAKDEGVYIEKVVKACKNIESHYVWPDAEQLNQDLDRLIYHQEEPFGSASIFAQWKVMELAKQNNVTVLLDGQGADEQLAGYIYFYKTYLDQLFYHQPHNYNKELNFYNNYHGSAFKLGSLSDTENFRMKMGRIKRGLLKQPMPIEPNALSNHLKDETQGWALKILLRYADRNAMAHSREVRLPFLSHHLVEFVFSLPDSYKLHEGWTKYILRKAMDNTLPKDIGWRVDKIGYEPPQKQWMEQPFMKDLLQKSRLGLKEINIPKEIDDWKALMIYKLYNHQ